MKIKLENFSATIDIESVEITNVNDNIKAKTASVDLVLNGKYGTTLNGFTYTTSWEDSEVLAWANNELNKHVIK
jgi:putative N-acetylmannosamine-6-phosphate epimerase